jgi:hypothetical protein
MLGSFVTPHQVRRTLELSCEAPIVPGFVSFNSLLGGIAALLLPVADVQRLRRRYVTQFLQNALGECGNVLGVAREGVCKQASRVRYSTIASEVVF